MRQVLLGALIGAIALSIYIYSQKERPESMESTDMTLSENSSDAQDSSVKEFTTTAYYDETGVWYSLKEIRAKKGDVVRIKATNTKGMHDFTIDEYSIQQELPLDEEVIIEFTADKTGEFVFYCSKPNHRAKGQWGTLIVE